MSPQALGSRHQRVQRLRRLLRRASARSSEAAFVAEGAKLVEAALGSGASIESLYLAPPARQQPGLVALAEQAMTKGARVFDLGPGVMEKVADTVSPQPICAVVATLDVGLEELLAPEPGAERLVLVCAGVRDPGNLGAVMRSGAAAGASGLVCCEETADPYNPKVVRASAGAIFELPLVISPDTRVVASELERAGFKTFATAAGDGTDYARAELSGDVALVLGNEANGLTKELSELFQERLTVPMLGRAESLNVAMTATIISHEIARRRRLR